MADLVAMLSAAAGAGGAASTTDPFFNQTTLLLHGDGTNGAQNNTFLDSSTNNLTITPAGNTTQGTFSPFSVAAGQFSNFFDGSSALSFEPGSITIDSGTDFCIEAWVYPTNLSAVNGGIFQAGTSNGSLGFRHNTDGTLRVLANAVSFQLDTTTALTNNEWYHIAATRGSGTLRIFINGVEDASTASSTDYTDPSSSNDFVVGGRFFSSAYQDEFYGYISNLRFVVGSAVYTSGFTPSTAPLSNITNTKLLTCQSNRFIDNSSDALVGTVGTGTPSVQPFSPFLPSAAYSPSVNGGSAYFDGGDDDLDVTGVPAIATSDVTVELFFFPTSATVAYRALYDGRSSIGTDTGISIFQYGLTIEIYGDGLKASSAADAFEINTWNHLAVVRTSGSLQIYINGVASGSAGTYSDNLTSTIRRMGEGANGANSYVGYISNLRETHSAVYTTTFTPPTAPLTAIANTELLLNFTNAGIFDNTGKNNLETVADAQIDTSVKKYGTGSMEFDGTGDYLQLKDTESFVFGSGDFTIEFWARINVTGTQVFFDTRPSDNSGTPLVIYTTASNLIFATPSTTRITGGALSIDTWYHIAVARSGTSTKMFLDGVQTGSTYTDTNVYTCGADRPLIGVAGFSFGSAPLNGYIDDLRITKGVARYTAAFTPPTEAFPDF